MRISTDQLDPGYSDLAKFAKVTIDGEDCGFAITACEENGLILFHKFDDNGNPVFSNNKEELAVFVRYGKVTISLLKPNKYVEDEFNKLRNKPIFYGHFEDSPEDSKTVLWKHNPTLNTSFKEQYNYNYNYRNYEMFRVDCSDRIKQIYGKAQVIFM